MKRLLKPWVFALLAALSLHAILFVWLEDEPWHQALPKLTPAHYLEVSLLPSDKSAPPPFETDSDEQVAAPQEATQIQTNAPIKPAEEIQAATDKIEQPSTAVSPTEVGIDNTQDISSAEQERPIAAQPITLKDIYDVTESERYSEHNWKNKSLLDIGPLEASRPKVDPSKDAFSPKFRQAVRQAKRVQEEYLKGIVEETEYPITEDADGTKYVNIKGLCWKMPEPGSMDAWQIVLSGCSGQKEVFRFELNITTDILRSDVFQGLPFGPAE